MADKGPLARIHIVLKPEDLQEIKHNNDIISTILQNCTSDATVGEKNTRDMYKQVFGVTIGNG
jgi:hypothetical protein